MNKLTKSVIVFSDADNTLWDTDSIFANAQTCLLDLVEKAVGRKAQTADRLGFVRQLDQELALSHHAGLRYPPKYLALSLSLVLMGEDPRQSVRSVWKGAASLVDVISEDEVSSIVTSYFKFLKRMPDLRAGVIPGLEELSKLGIKPIIVTESEKRRCTGLIESLGLKPLIDRVISSPKSPQLYSRVMKLGGGYDQGYMIGDQLDRDIAPARKSGLTTIYFPGGFKPNWEKSLSSVNPDFQISSFEEVVDIILNRPTPK